VKTHHLKKKINRKALSDYLKSRTAAGGKFSYRNVAARAGLSHATIGNIIQMKYKRDVNLGTLRALAEGLEEDETLILSVAYGESINKRELEEEFTKTILLDFEQLKAEDREFLRPYLYMLRQELDRRLSSNQTSDEAFGNGAIDEEVGSEVPAATEEEETAMEKPEKDKPGINIVKLTERIQKAHPEISFEMVVSVLSSDAPEEDEPTQAIINSYAGQTDTGKDNHRTNGE
jgi:transcriptional regulator with XRE-family HTH domain